MDWQYFSEPNSKSCLAMIDGKCSLHRGKAIGGSSVLNGMLYVRGDKDDYDNWAKAGNDGWSYEDVLPYFKKSMDQQDLNLARNTKLYARGGPLTVETLDFKTAASFAFLEGNIGVYAQLNFEVGFLEHFMKQKAYISEE